MRQLTLFGLTVLLLASAADAQDRFACISKAQLKRDTCLRAAAPNEAAARHCYTEYISTVNRCRIDALNRQNRKPDAIQRFDPPKSR